MTTTAPAASHCESCGQASPGTYDGYTTCCNELVCDGPGRGWAGYRWAVGTMEPRVTMTTVYACCSFTAQAAARTRNPAWDALHREA